jgi:glycosyltransferase involved in cell wall biosynthesis
MNPEEQQIRPRRVVLLTNIPSPYRVPFFKELSSFLDFHVVFDALTEGNRHWQTPASLPINHSYARGFTVSYTRRRRDGFPQERRELHLRPGILAELIRIKPELVVSQELGFRSLVALMYCAARNVPLILWQEGTAHTEGWVGLPKQFLRRRLCRFANRIWGNGIQSAALVHAYAPQTPTDDGMTGVDTNWFAQGVRALLPERDAMRLERSVRRVCFLCVGQLVERKGVRQLLEAVGRTEQIAQDFTLLLAGEGPLRAEVEAWQRGHPEFDLRILGQLAPEELLKMYAIADVLLLPTLDDNWALATLEGAVAGLPQIFSKYNGAFVELTAYGVAGEVIDPLDLDAFVACLKRFVARPPQRLPDETVDALVLYYSPREFALRAVTSIGKALSHI